jgi:hypothetical protein
VLRTTPVGAMVRMVLIRVVRSPAAAFRTICYKAMHRRTIGIEAHDSTGRIDAKALGQDRTGHIDRAR